MNQITRRQPIWVHRIAPRPEIRVLSDVVRHPDESHARRALVASGKPFTRILGVFSWCPSWRYGQAVYEIELGFYHYDRRIVYAWVAL